MNRARASLNRLDKKLVSFKAKYWYETPEGKRELARQLAGMLLSVMGGQLGSTKIVSCYPDNPCRFEGLPTERVIETHLDRPGPAEGYARLEKLRLELFPNSCTTATATADQTEATATVDETETTATVPQTDDGSWPNWNNMKP